MRQNVNRVLASILIVMLVLGMLATTAFATEAEANDTYFSISESDNDQKYYGSIMLGDPVMTLEPDKIYHMELQWTFHSLDEAIETAKYVALSFEYPQQCLKGRMGDLSANIYSSTVNSTCIVLSFWAGDNIEIEDVAGSYRLYCDDLQDGSIADVYGLDLGWDHEISVGNLARDHAFRLAFDIHTKSFIPTTSEQGTGITESEGQNDVTAPNNSGKLDPATSTEPEAPEESYDPSLPRVFKGEVDSSSRELFTEEHRPDYAVFNSVTDNSDYGDETKFIRITDLSTGEVYQEGTIELTPGRQYQVEIFYRNDATYKTTSFGTKFSRDAKRSSLLVTMPYELAAGTTERFVATISAENTMPLAVSTGLNLTSRYGLYLEYADGSAVWQKDGSDEIETVAYEKLFRDGAYLGSIGSGSYGTISFVIRATSDGSTPLEELPADVTPNSGTTGGFLDGKIWNLYMPVIWASVLITLLVIVIIVALLDLLASRFHPALRSFPIIRHCVPMPPTKPLNQDDAEETLPKPALTEEHGGGGSAGDDQPS